MSRDKNSNKAKTVLLKTPLHRAQKSDPALMPPGLTEREKSVKSEILKRADARKAFYLFVNRGFTEKGLLATLCVEAWGPEIIWKHERHCPSRAENKEMRDSLVAEALRLRKKASEFPPHISLDLNQAAGRIIRHASILRSSLWNRPSIQQLKSKCTVCFLKEVKVRTRYASLEQVAALLRVTHPLARRGDRVSRESLRYLLRVRRG